MGLLKNVLCKIDNTETWYKCLVCGRVGTVGRCCSNNKREPLNKLAKEEREKLIKLGLEN